MIVQPEVIIGAAYEAPTPSLSCWLENSCLPMGLGTGCM